MSITEWNGFKYKVISRVPRYGSTVYTIEKLAGNWPQDTVLILLCDSINPALISYCYGGVVKINSINNCLATVDVYID